MFKKIISIAMDCTMLASFVTNVTALENAVVYGFEKKEEKWSEIEEYLAEMESDMDGVPFDDFSFMKEELCEKKEEEYSFDTHRKLLIDYTK